MYRITPGKFVGYRLLATIGFPLIWLWMATSTGMSAVLAVLGAVFCALMGWWVPTQLVKDRAKRRLAAIDYELPELIDLLVVTIEAGLGRPIDHIGFERLVVFLTKRGKLARCGRIEVISNARAHRAPGVADVVRGARERRRRQPGGQRNEHLLRVRDAHAVGQEAAPPLHRRAEAVCRHEGDARAISAAAAPALRALSARDLEGDADELAGRQRADRIPELHHFRHALVADRERRLKGRVSADDERVEIARRDRDRPHERGAI